MYKIFLTTLIILCSETLFAHSSCTDALTKSELNDILNDIFYSIPDENAEPLKKKAYKHTDKQNRLTRAAYEGNLKKVKYLVSRRIVSVNVHHTILGYTPLMYAAGEGHVDIVKYFLNRKELIVNDTNDFDSTALIEGIFHPEVVKLLLAHPDTDVNMQDLTGMTALIFASKFGIVESVKLLLERDELNKELVDEDGKTALMWAEENGHLEIRDLLLPKN